jgi:hypothetical protein
MNRTGAHNLSGAPSLFYRHQNVESVVAEAMEGALGRRESAAAAFYIDIAQAKKNPEAFVASVRRFFGSGSFFLERSISGVLTQKFGITAGCASLAETLQAAMATGLSL